MISIVRIARSLRREDGIALPTVIGVGFVMLIMIAGAMTVATRGVVKAGSDEDWSGALAAAYAGVEEYQSRLANDSTYQKYGNPAAPFSAASGSTNSLILPVAPNINPAFGIGTSGTWTNVPGSDSLASFRYEVDNSDYQTQGTLHLRSTGRVGNVTRSVVADLKQDGFIDYLYFTDYEVQDPAYSGATAVDANNVSVCQRHSYDTPARPTANPPTGCGQIQFGQFDTFTGPVRSNDNMLICGTTFKGLVITSSPSNPSWSKPSGCGVNPSWAPGETGPRFQASIDMPQTNKQMIRETRNDLPADVPNPGCLYTGPTVITFEINGGVPQMRVMSPWTKFTNTAAGSTGATKPAQCGAPGSADGQLGGKTGAVVPVLNLNLVYVQPVSSDATNPNSWTAGTTPTNVVCTAAAGAAPAGWAYRTVVGSTTTYYQRFPLENEAIPTGGGTAGLNHYDCRGGDVFIKGTLSGQTTIAAANYIYVTGNLVYKSRQTDILGLVGDNAVFVWNPLNSSDQSLLADTDREIDAAILSVGHTFQVQNFDQGGNRGRLTVFGAIAQKYRGTVSTSSNGTVSTGYAKDYQYDSRYKNTAPPKFLTPVSTTYGVTQFATVPAAFTATGANG